MINSYKGRVLDYSKPVLIYRNLRNDLLSIKQDDVVVGHTEQAMIHKAEFVVRDSGRERVLRERQKNVHAYIHGFLIADYNNDPAYTKFINSDKLVDVYYNPYKYSGFTDGTTILKGCEYIHIEATGQMKAQEVY